ncbi:hypothetical protein I4641_22355 [Waterburya agarophytonicola K14]|uniref:Uncharacterized protein n=1 Tax=Waterburya agarophytonicola KI4 TaxID=2874699 RepID=A0A964BX62_9CYAN|nr:hypothetical protein [Waterburya agarophytonicola]MCC0179693.1 hypothetical protein [Waterburya agarophytonicola KI4]
MSFIPMFETMFERATVFSATLLFVIMGIVGVKYFNFLDSKTQVTKTSMDYQQLSLPPSV